MSNYWVPLLIVGIGIVGNVLLTTVWGEEHVQSLAVRDTLRIVTYIAAVFPTLFSYIRAEERYKKSEKERRKREALDKMRDLLRAAIVKIFEGEDPETIRANIMIEDGGELTILCSINMEFNHDYNIRLAYGHGCAGMAWKRACEAPMSERWVPVLAPKTQLSTKRLRDEWHLTDEQIGITRHVLWILSVPIFQLAGSETKFLGVLSFDGVRKPLKDVHRLKDHTLHIGCADVAEYFGSMLLENNILN